jgi:hypothetical protein
MRIRAYLKNLLDMLICKPDVKDTSIRTVQPQRRPDRSLQNAHDISTMLPFRSPFGFLTEGEQLYAVFTPLLCFEHHQCGLGRPRTQMEHTERAESTLSGLAHSRISATLLSHVLYQASCMNRAMPEDHRDRHSLPVSTAYCLCRTMPCGRLNT